MLKSVHTPLAGMLLLGSTSRRVLLDELEHAGFDPTVCTHHTTAVTELMQSDVAGILVDAQATGVDLLEFILDVREIDLHTPVAVLGNGLSRREAAILRRLPNTYLMGSRANIKLGVRRFAKIVLTGADPGGSLSS
jgi:hypothetical protein